MIDIIIVNYNSTDYLIPCLISVKRSLSSMPAKVYVEDNASKDGAEIIREKFPWVVLTQNKANIGFAAAVNQALTQGDNPFVVLLNPDTIVPDNFFKASIQFMNNHPRVGIMGPKVLEKDGTTLQNSARSFPTLLTSFFGRTSFLTRLFPNNPITLKSLPSLKSDGQSPMDVDWVSGACMVVNRKAVEVVGGLDNRFFMYWEDADWCRRMWESQWRVTYCPSISIRHYTGASSQKEHLRSVIEFHKSAFRLFEKYKNPIGSPFFNLFIIMGLFLRSIMALASQKK